MARAFARSAVTAIDSLYAESVKPLPPADQFRIPVDPADSVRLKVVGEASQIIAGFPLSLYDKLFPRDSWPWGLARDITFAVCTTGYPATPATLVEQIDRAQPGAVSLLAFALLIEKHGSDQQRAGMAARLKRIDLDELVRTESFRDDARLLTDTNYGLGRIAMHTADALRNLSDGEQQLLLTWLPADSRAAAGRFIQSLKQGPAHSPATLAAALDDLWQAHFRAYALREFQRLRASQ
jgi:hypothetical protein